MKNICFIICAHITPNNFPPKVTKKGSPKTGSLWENLVLKHQDKIIRTTNKNLEVLLRRSTAYYLLVVLLTNHEQDTIAVMATVK